MKTRSYNPLVAILILNYCNSEDTLTAIASLRKLSYRNNRIILVDNGSGDQSAEIIASHTNFISQGHPQGVSLPVWSVVGAPLVGALNSEDWYQCPDVEIIRLEVNSGYSVGNNVGIKAALSFPETDYIWLLNNDTTVDPDTLDALVDMAQSHPGSIIGSLVLYPDGRFQRVGNHLNRYRGSLKSYSETEIKDGQTVESLTGCSMLVPREVFKTIGLLNEDYFLYFEDNDFCIRAANAGFSSIVAMKSRVYHKEGSTTGRNRPLVTYYYQRNRLILAEKFFSSFQWILVQLYTLYRLFRGTIKIVTRNSPVDREHHRALKLAVSDFYRGIRGKCPHDI